MDVVRGYTDRDAVAVEEALSGLDASSWTEVYAFLSGLLHSTVSIMELSGKRWQVGELVRHTEEVAAVAPPHHEFAVVEATRAWARGDESAMHALSCQDLPGAVHMTAVGVVVLGLALWGRPGFLAVLEEFQVTADALANDRFSGG